MQNSIPAWVLLDIIRINGIYVNDEALTKYIQLQVFFIHQKDKLQKFFNFSSWIKIWDIYFKSQDFIFYHINFFFGKVFYLKQSDL